MTYKDLIKSFPGAKRLASLIRLGRGEARFEGSAAYWDRRYREGGNSGAGSYNRLAQFKAQVLNEFVETRRIQTVVEFGTGDGAQLSLAAYPRYIGVDVSPTVIVALKKRFLSDHTKSFFTTTDYNSPSSELALSLDVIYHLVEDEVFETYMRRLFAAATRHVVIYSSNEDKAWAAQHVRHREFTRWVEEREPKWRLEKRVLNAFRFDEQDQENTSFADFFIYSLATAGVN